MSSSLLGRESLYLGVICECTLLGLTYLACYNFWLVELASASAKCDNAQSINGLKVID